MDTDDIIADSWLCCIVRDIRRHYKHDDNERECNNNIDFIYFLSPHSIFLIQNAPEKRVHIDV